MIEFIQLPDDHKDFSYSPLLRGALLTLDYADEKGFIGLTATKAFKRNFVGWAVEHFDWPGKGRDELQFHKVLNEYDFQPLELLHFLLVELELGRYHKNEFRTSKKGRTLALSPGKLFLELVPPYLLNVDHASYCRLDERPMGDWDTWLNVLNVGFENGMSERALFVELYGGSSELDDSGMVELGIFSNCVLQPLEWSGLISVHNIQGKDRSERMCFKTPLWRSSLQLDTDDMLVPSQRH